MNRPLVNRDRRAVLIWLCLCALLVAVMVLVGGYTRLSGSGLSITEWKPVHGVVPPLSENAWQEEFSAYRATPQYKKINQGMTLADFKVIYWPEFIHRLLGRLVGVAFFLPLMVFSLRHSISGRFGLRLLTIFALGGLQGLIGWLMVRSGLVDTPYVNHVRLALHLSVAFGIFALIVWAVLDIVRRSPLKLLSQNTNIQSKPIVFYRLWFAGLCLQIVLGAFVAGLHAGLIFNTYPTMNGQWIPGGLFAMSPWYDNILLNLTTIQFMHRTLAALLAIGFILWWRLEDDYVKNNALGKQCALLALALAAQFGLGVMTLLRHVPLNLALAHQMTALLLFALSTALLHRLDSLQKI